MSDALVSDRWPDADSERSLDTLRQVEQRVLWLATSIVDHANRLRPHADGLKVGGHQASSASMVSIMTSSGTSSSTQQTGRQPAGR
jgi:pyruvate dehydrogenase E1 component